MHRRLVLKRVADIGRSLLTEGYRYVVNVQLPGSKFVKMRHKSNGNEISIIGNFSSGWIRTVKNGKVVNQENVVTHVASI